MIIVYGIPNCDTVKKARLWFSERDTAYTFHDFKKQGVPPLELARWCEEAGWEKLLNRNGTTWRKLEPTEQAAVVDAASAQSLMLAHPSAIKRPVVDWGQNITVGFDPVAWTEQV